MLLYSETGPLKRIKAKGSHKCLNHMSGDLPVRKASRCVPERPGEDRVSEVAI